MSLKRSANLVAVYFEVNENQIQISSKPTHCSHICNTGSSQAFIRGL